MQENWTLAATYPLKNAAKSQNRKNLYSPNALNSVHHTVRYTKLSRTQPFASAGKFASNRSPPVRKLFRGEHCEDFGKTHAL